MIYDQEIEIAVTVKPNGTWSVADKSRQPGISGAAVKIDSDGDETRDRFQVPSE